MVFFVRFVSRLQFQNPVDAEVDRSRFGVAIIGDGERGGTGQNRILTKFAHNGTAVI